MIILAIETSCDETAVAIVKAGGKNNPRFEILSNIISSQVKLHAKYGGVYPSLAKREHQKNLPIIYKKALKEAGFKNYKLQITNYKKIINPKNKKTGIDLVAVTVGPGLEPCLWVGINFAEDLAKKLKVSIIPVNHIEAHIMANFIGQIQNSKFKIQNLFPAVCLVVSGGHTQLILMKDFGKYKILGETRDDAAGECFDKVARVLGLGYPGGPAISALAEKFQIKSAGWRNKLQINLPRPMIYQKNYDFSFSGLKTAVLYDFKSRLPKIRKSRGYVYGMAAEVQQAVIDVLIYKTLKVAKNYRAKAVILGGGVTANNELRKQFGERIKKELPDIKCLIPDKEYTTDNAAMVAVTAYYNRLSKKTIKKKMGADANLRVS